MVKKIISQFLIVLICSLSISCSNEKNKTQAILTDTTTPQTPEELKLLNDQLIAEPTNANLYYKRANYYFDKKNVNASFADISKALTLDSSKSDYYLTLSDIYFIENRTGDSKKMLERCIKIDEKNTIAIMKLAELFLYVKKFKESIEWINKALMIDKYNAKAYFMKGMNYKELGDTVRAISSMQTAVEQDQKYYNAYMQLGILCAATHNQLASQYYKNALRIEPYSTEAFYDIGKFYQDEGDYSNSIESYNSLLKLAPQNKYAHYNLGVIYFSNLKKYEEAIDHYTQAIGIEANYVQAYYARGICYKTMGNIKKAVTDFQSCTAIKPDFEPALEAIKELGATQN